jgi:glycosyltransferase involved in cell wall biosynthesis
MNEIIEPLDNGTYQKAKGGTEMMYGELIKRLPQHLVDKTQIICSRIRNLDPTKKKVLWLHDTWDDPENEHLKYPELRKRFSKLVFVSNYQFQTYHQAYGITYEESVVLKNCVQPFTSINKPDINERVNLIYHTTPHRGLELLVPVFVKMAQSNPKLHLDVYSSFDIYGWPQRNAPYEPLFDICRNHPQIDYHGTVPNADVRSALEKAHIFAFPSIWPETSCIAVMEAMAAEVAVVCSDYAALSETTMGNAMMYRFQETPVAHANLFMYALQETIKNLTQNDLRKNLTFAKNQVIMNYSWEYRIPQWIELLENL